MEVKSSDLSSGWSGEAWRASWTFVVENRLPAFIVAVLVPVFVACIQFKWRSLEMNTAIITAVWTLVIYVGICLTVYLVFFFYFTPKHIITELGNELAAALGNVAALEEARKPRIRAYCGKDVEGCVVPDSRGIWYRARLEITGAEVSGLEASIVGLSENDHKLDLYGEYMVMLMGGSETKGSKLIREGRPEYINLVFAAHDKGTPPVLSLKHYPDSIGDKVNLRLGHEYWMDIVLHCDDTHPSLPFRACIKLNANDNLEQLRMVS
jgi:hypothetical protein